MFRSHGHFRKWLSQHGPLANAATAQAPGTFEFAADFRTLPPVKASVDHLKHQMFANITLAPRAIGLLYALDRSADQHTLMIAELNKLVLDAHKAELTDEQSAAFYFGLKVGKRIDERYPSTLAGLYSTTDDCIMFSRLLGEELVRHGRSLAPKLPKRLRGGYPNADFTAQEREGLMPNPKEYPSWMLRASTIAKRRRPWERVKRAFNALSE